MICAFKWIYQTHIHYYVEIYSFNVIIYFFSKRIIEYYFIYWYEAGLKNSLTWIKLKFGACLDMQSKFSVPVNVWSMCLKNFYYCAFSPSRWQIVLTEPKLENERFISFPAVIFIGCCDMLIINVRSSASFSGKWYHSILYEANPTLLN